MRPLVVLFVVLLAGCASPSGADDEAPADEGQDPGRQSAGVDAPEVVGGRYADNVTSIDTSLFLPGLYFGVEGTNCIWFDDGLIERIHDGFVEVSWESQSPADETRELVVKGNETLRASGPSPLRLELNDLEPRPDGLAGVLFFVQPEGYGANVKLPVQFTWDFHYDGKADLKYDEAGCGA